MTRETTKQVQADRKSGTLGAFNIDWRTHGMIHQIQDMFNEAGTPFTHSVIVRQAIRTLYERVVAVERDKNKINEIIVETIRAAKGL